MIQDLTKLYEGADLEGETEGVIYLPILLDCNLQGVDVKTDEGVADDDAVFALFKNGVEMSGIVPTVVVGTKIDSITGLDIDLVKGDEIVLNLVSGNISAPVTLNLVVDDGVEVGGDGGDGGGAVGYSNIVDQCDDLDFPNAVSNLSLSDYDFTDAPDFGDVYIKSGSGGDNWVEYRVDHLYRDEFLDIKLRYMLHVSGAGTTPFYIQASDASGSYSSTFNLSGSTSGASAGGWQAYEATANLLTLTGIRNIKFVKIWLVAAGDIWTIGLGKVELNYQAP